MLLLATLFCSKTAGRLTHALVIYRKSFEFEDASSLQSLYPSSPTENGTESQPKFGSKSTLEENAYEDIVGKQWGWAGSAICGATEEQEPKKLLIGSPCSVGQMAARWGNSCEKWAT